MIRNQKGFTLIEIIAVLVILGILAAVAIPKYLNLQADAKQKAAEGQVAELKGTLSSGWGKGFLASGVAPTADQARANAILTTDAATIGVGQDNWSYQLVVINSTGYNIKVLGRGETPDNGYNASGTWFVPAP